jgi:hypothetical protein
LSERETGTAGGSAEARHRILIISFSDMARDARVLRQVKHLATKHEVTAIGFGDPQVPGVDFIRIHEKKKTLVRNAERAVMLKVHNYLGYYNKTFDVGKIKNDLESRKFDLIIANDSDSLPMVFSWGHGAKVLHDAHEYAPRQIEDRWTWRFFMQRYMEWICRTYLPQCDAVTTVSDGIAAEYQKNFGVKPAVITNAPEYWDLQPSPVQEGKVRMIHHGNANPSRKLENLIDLMGHLDERFTLDLYLMPRDPAYLEKIRDMAAGDPRIKVMDPVPMQQLVPMSNRYDVGIFFQEPLNFNLTHSLPNKFFEFVQSRLTIAISPLPEMERIVRMYDLGVVSKDFRPISMAQELKGLDAPRIAHFKQRAHAAARDLSSETNMNILDSLIETILVDGGNSPGHRASSSEQ